MNPFQPELEEKKNFFGKKLIEWIGTGTKKKKTWQFSKMKEKQIAKRRMRNKMASKSRRINRLVGA